MKTSELAQIRTYAFQALSIACAGTFAFAAFYLYSGFRTFSDTVGLTLNLGLWGLVAGLVVPFVVFVPALLSLNNWLWPQQPAKPLVLLIFASQLTGCVTGEILLTRDEAAFAREASGATTLYVRDRAWPNESSSLVYVPGQGIHDSG